jgi:hypothetical protein
MVRYRGEKRQLAVVLMLSAERECPSSGGPGTHRATRSTRRTRAQSARPFLERHAPEPRQESDRERWPTPAVRQTLHAARVDLTTIRRQFVFFHEKG